ncbi:UDP-Glycosyltransferase/glycogen phosphorylase [Nemania sp. FL0031]|nr:UDP-Glycosyltransferase/glycogen phosphorylase [Nemania sp. FL0031]
MPASPIRRSTAGTIFVVFAALLLSWRPSLLSRTPVAVPPVIGQNNTALFLTTSDYGLSNVHVATAQALLERQPHIRLHYGSFAPMASRLERLCSHTKRTYGKDVIFHPIHGFSVIDTCRSFGKNTSNSIHAPGWAGINQLCQDMQLFISPWKGEDHLAIYEEIGRIIDEVDPAVIVLDTLFRPAIDATRDKNRLHAIISPNTLIENFPAVQPWGKMLWKYPAMGSGLPYPVPWRKIPENILLNLKFISTMIWMPEMKEKQAFLKSKGLKDPINFFALHRPDVPWLSQTMPEAAIPVDIIPENVTCTGPITLSLGTVEEQDKELASWLKRAPTVLVNLGSGYEFSEESATAMAKAIEKVLQASNVQVLWKIKKDSSYDDHFMDPLLTYTHTGRVKIERWLAADPTALLESGHVIASVHHGGSGCYHEAISAGIPQVILPLWLDLYGFAQLAEYTGVGVWGCRESSPVWTADCLSHAILRVVDGIGHKSFRDNAQRLQVLAQARPGRYVAAEKIAHLAGSGT